MAQIEESGSGRRVNVDVNIVPFIDLMSVLIIFLLITAVWTQVSMIQIGSSIYGPQSVDTVTEPPPHSDIPLRIDVLTGGFRIYFRDRPMTVPNLPGGIFDVDGLLNRLKEIKTELPLKEDAVLTAANEVAYEHLIEGMDAALAAGFTSLSVATVEVK